ncbi:hypothetical protein WA1_46885 [Scytonema hofmannii PCC 7110]|uniref:DUF1156 domain-containing protein n=1 Tax=Scytonema hofmannii PCC 7110 TaxID=128403 RepID=A0A139WXK9_9CYAN|nr:DUF1156 domain-containing protein [Scytonema hofmannii]KYC37160.1 hypothetical protein WA1_46885 [Scytonema hofmannii PCC 7110]
MRTQQEQEKKHKNAKTEAERDSISLKPADGTINRKGTTCICCGTPVPTDYIRTEGKVGQMSAQLMAIVAEGQRQRVYLSPNREHAQIASKAKPEWEPLTELPKNPRWFSPPLYGLNRYAEIFTPRQLSVLTTFSDLVSEVQERIKRDVVASGISDSSLPLCQGGVDALAYADATATYLAFGISRLMDLSSTLCPWSSNPAHELVVHMFARQAIPMTWDFGEINPFCQAASWSKCLEFVPKVLDKLAIQDLSTNNQSVLKVYQKDATAKWEMDTVKFCISTDPPYYDAIGYADLSDFFYVWLRRSLGKVYTNLFSTVVTPKSEELIATPYRFDGNKKKAQVFFEEGLGKAFASMNGASCAEYPLTVFYAFKQSEADENSKGSKSSFSIASTGWETMLEGLLSAGFSVTGTWPMRTERPTGIKAKINALATSIVLVCRPRPENAPSTTRRQFLNELKRELPEALKNLQQGNIAPVDLAQASIGPGMAIFSRYSKVLDADGVPMRVRTALQLINQMLDEYLTEQEGEFDADTRYALTWFEQHQYNEGLYGDAETLSKAKNTSVQGLVNGGILTAKSGKVRLLRREELPKNWNPATDSRISDWEITQYLIYTLDQKGEMASAAMLAQLGSRGETARDLAYRLYSICDRKGWTQEAIGYNSIVISWSEISRLAVETKQEPVQGQLF